MFRLLLVCALVACAFGRTPQWKAKVPMLNDRIVGGESVNIEDYPYQVSLLWLGSHLCGGSIISSRYVITAAHCTYGYPDVTEYSIRAGSSIRNSGGIVIDVQTIYENPDFDYWLIDHDITVLELSEELDLTAAGVGIIGLPSPNQAIIAGDISVVSGWGTLTEGGVSANQLQAVRVPVVSIEECRAAYGEEDITDRMMCAGVPEGGRDACQGDSGGPLVIDGQLIGIVSWGYGCARPGFPGVYSSVPALRGFITQSSGI